MFIIVGQTLLNTKVGGGGIVRTGQEGGSYLSLNIIGYLTTVGGGGGELIVQL